MRPTWRLPPDARNFSPGWLLCLPGAKHDRERVRGVSGAGCEWGGRLGSGRGRAGRTGHAEVAWRDGDPLLRPGDAATARHL